jgi:hypothetical protein
MTISFSAEMLFSGISWHVTLLRNLTRTVSDYGTHCKVEIAVILNRYCLPFLIRVTVVTPKFGLRNVYGSKTEYSNTDDCVSART